MDVEPVDPGRTEVLPGHATAGQHPEHLDQVGWERAAGVVRGPLPVDHLEGHEHQCVGSSPGRDRHDVVRWDRSRRGDRLQRSRIGNGTGEVVGPGFGRGERPDPVLLPRRSVGCRGTIGREW